MDAAAAADLLQMAGDILFHSQNLLHFLRIYTSGRGIILKTPIKA